MIFRTELQADHSPFTISHDTPVLLLGSCFSQNMGFKLQKYKFKCIVNPFGTIFNPVSISRLITKCVIGSPEVADSLLFSSGRWVHPDFHSQTGHPDKAEALRTINQLITDTRAFLKNCQVLFITLGSSVVYEYKQTGKIVANCHKIPAIHFEKKELEVHTMSSEMETTLTLLKSFNPNIHVVWTVSPVRHIKDGIVVNSFSKARLHVVIENIIKNTHNTSYFPAYEWMMDDLRDYRFYDRDLIHPSDVAVDYIWEKFSGFYFDSHTRIIINELDKIQRDQNHRPFSTETEEYQKFLQSLENRKLDFKQKYPSVPLD
jgi:hypothetical protein